MKSIRIFRPIAIAGLAATLMAFQPALPQQPAEFEVPASQAPLGAADLHTLVGPIALYPDDLVGVVLPASTYPLQIVQASRFLDDFESDDSLEPDPDWDDSVVALLNYPEVLRMMDANIDWTWALGEAVLDQQPDVLDAIQTFRSEALQAGNLVSNEQQSVSQNDDGLIEIAPAEPEVIYIPYYEPERVVVVQPAPVLYYYSRPYPIYYYPYPFGFSFGYTFGTPFFWGVSAAFNIGWHSHVVHVYHHNYYAHPYYGRPYYSPYYSRHGVSVAVNYTNHVWEPRHRYAGRPRRTASGVRSVASSEGQAPNLRNANYSQVRARTQSRTAGRTDSGRDFAQRSASSSGERSRAAQNGQGAAQRNSARLNNQSSQSAQRTVRQRPAAATAPAARPGSATSPRSTVRQRTTASPGSAASQRSTPPLRSSAAQRSVATQRPGNTQRSYAGRPVTAPTRTAPTFSGSRDRSVSSAQSRSAPVVQSRTQRAQPAPPVSTLGQRKAFGAGRSSNSSSSGRAAISNRSSGAVRSAPRAAPAGRSQSAGRQAAGGRTRSHR